MGCRRVSDPTSVRKFRVAPRATYAPLDRLPAPFGAGRSSCQYALFRVHYGPDCCDRSPQPRSSCPEPQAAREGSPPDPRGCPELLASLPAPAPLLGCWEHPKQPAARSPQPPQPAARSPRSGCPSAPRAPRPAPRAPLRKSEMGFTLKALPRATFCQRSFPTGQDPHSLNTFAAGGAYKHLGYSLRSVESSTQLLLVLRPDLARS
jgi:hypothetical protein